MSNALENGGIANAISRSNASFVAMHPESSTFYTLADGVPSPVGTSLEGKMPEQVRAIACLLMSNALIL